jgi:3-deoxy-D-manno-octulosonic-acid transferase
MRKFWFIVYNVVIIPSLWLGFRIYAIFNSKVRRGLTGRRGLLRNMSRSLSPFKNGYKRVLIHCSSLGEYQQAIPLIEEMQGKKLDITVSFFSPSGYENSKIPFPDVRKIYLPFDTVNNVIRFLSAMRFDTIIFMRYDLWYNLVYEAKKRGIKLIMANARLDEDDIFWKVPVLNSFKKTLYRMVDAIFVIDEEDRDNYAKYLTAETEIRMVGDSKYERVYAAATNKLDESLIKTEVIKGKKVFVIGSSWKDDEDIVLPVVNRILEFEMELLTFLVPHEPKVKKIDIIEKTIREQYTHIKAIRFSNISEYAGENLIIVDRIGILMSLYSIAYVSYVGGGLKSGLHNILEPAIFNMPVFFANKVKNSDEDVMLLKTGCGKVVEDQRGFYRNFRAVLKDPALRDSMARGCRFVFEGSLGTAKKIVETIN